MAPQPGPGPQIRMAWHDMQHHRGHSRSRGTNSGRKGEEEKGKGLQPRGHMPPDQQEHLGRRGLPAHAKEPGEVRHSVCSSYKRLIKAGPVRLGEREMELRVHRKAGQRHRGAAGRMGATVGQRVKKTVGTAEHRPGQRAGPPAMTVQVRGCCRAGRT